MNEKLRILVVDDDTKLCQRAHFGKTSINTLWINLTLGSLS